MTRIKYSLVIKYISPAGIDVSFSSAQLEAKNLSDIIEELITTRGYGTVVKGKIEYA